MLTSNEKIVLKYLLLHFHNESSINQIARECRLSPNGAYKILLKFEEEKILQCLKIANLKSFKINPQPKTLKVLEYLLLEEAENLPEELKALAKQKLEPIEIALFNEQKKELLLVLDESDFGLAKEKLYSLKKIKLVLRTREEILRERNYFLPYLQNSLVLWGEEKLLDLLLEK